MKELLSFPLLLVGFLASSALIHWLLRAAQIDGLLSFMAYCAPLLGVISYTTMADNESFGRCLLRNAGWAYSFILGMAAIAWIL